jgi:hypothetical protein
MNKRLFVSYSRKDFELVDEFVESTEHFDFNVWIDKRDQEYGKKWRDNLTHAIDESDGAILFVTINSLDSRAVRELEIPKFLEQKDTRGEDFKLYIVILDYVPEKLLEEFKTEQGEYIFKERHIKNVSANRLDSDQKLPSEMMPGARQKYWYKLCEEISEDINYLAEYKKPILKVSEKNKKNLKRLIKYSVSSSILFLLLYAGYFGFNQLNNTVNNTLQNFNETLEGLSNSNNTNSNQEIDNQNPVVTVLEESENLPTTIASSTTTSTSTSTSTTTSTTIRVTPTTAPVDPANGSSQIKLGEKYKLNILNQTYEWLDELFLQWANSARVYSVTQYEEGVVLSFTPLYDLNGYKLYLNGENIGSVNHFGAWYTKYNNIVLKGLKESEFYTLEIYVVDRYYREFGPITYDFQYVWNSDDGFPYNNLSYNEFNGILIGNFSNNTGGDGNERPILKSDLNNIDIATYDLGTNAYPRYQVIISNLVYEKFTHFVVVEGDQMIFLSNVLNFYITEDILDKYIKIIPFNNIFNNGESVDLLITKSMFEN